jgi:hypothetical protein
MDDSEWYELQQTIWVDCCSTNQPEHADGRPEIACGMLGGDLGSVNSVSWTASNVRWDDSSARWELFPARWNDPSVRGNDPGMRWNGLWSAPE